MCHKRYCEDTILIIIYNVTKDESYIVNQDLSSVCATRS